MKQKKSNSLKPSERGGTSARLFSQELKDRSSRFYTIAEDGTSITCHVCGFTSHDPKHVKDRFCPRCLVFHDDRTLMLRLTEGYQKEFETVSEESTWVKAAA